MGLSEEAEGVNPMCFVEDMRYLLPDALLSPHYAVDWAHQVSPNPGPPGPPRGPFILRILNFRDRDKILCASRVLGDLRFQSNKLLIFLDYSVETEIV